jgi:hypothetical protein
MFVFSAPPLDHIRDHLWKGCIAWHGRQNLLASNRVWARPSANQHGHGIDEISVNSCFEPAKTEARDLMVAATSRAAGPVNGERIHARTQFFVKSLGKRESAALCFD